MGVRYDQRQRMRFLRALQFVVARQAEGANNPIFLRGDRAVGSRRASGSALNARKCAGLGWALFQHFIDNFYGIHGRSDSHLLLEEAKNLRAVLSRNGHPESDLPKLIGNVGHSWFRRWRLMYNISLKSSWMKLSVSYKKINKRIRVYLSNVFRLRKLWELCFPGKEMRFMSLDQKPSWFNNAGHTGTFGIKGKSRVPKVKENAQEALVFATLPNRTARGRATSARTSRPCLASCGRRGAFCGSCLQARSRSRSRWLAMLRKHWFLRCIMPAPRECASVGRTSVGRAC